MSLRVVKGMGTRFTSELSLGTLRTWKRGHGFTWFGG